MPGLLIAALGLGLSAWHLRALSGRASLHPDFLKGPLGSLSVFLLGAGALLWGGILTVSSWGTGGIFLIILFAIAFIAVVLAGASRNALVRELEASLARHRGNYPELDEEALFRFAVKDRHPDWDNRRIQDMTEDCLSVEELARRLNREENSVR